MATDPSPRVADVLLRDPAPRTRARIHWPACPGRPGLVVLFTDPDDPCDLAARLVEALGAIVLAVPAAHTVEAHATVAWAADHAAELGARPDLALVGTGRGAALAERVAALAADEGWPPLRGVAAVWPGDDPAPALEALATGWDR